MQHFKKFTFFLLFLSFFKGLLLSNQESRNAVILNFAGPKHTISAKQTVMPRLLLWIVMSSSFALAFHQKLFHEFNRLKKITPSVTSERFTAIDILERKAFSRKLGENSFAAVDGFARFLSPSAVGDTKNEVSDNVKDMEGGMVYLEEVAGKKSQLNPLDLTFVFGAVAFAVTSPLFLSCHTLTFVVPAMTAVSFTVGSVYEYFGKVAVSNGRESSAACFLAVAESEIIYCQAERVKSVLPLCVGIATTAAALTLFVPAFAASPLGIEEGFVIDKILSGVMALLVPTYAGTESVDANAHGLTAFFSLIAVLAAAIAGLANEETRGMVDRSQEIGRRRFVTSVTDGGKWESDTDLVLGRAEKFNNKWLQFAVGVVPAPFIASFFPGGYELQGVICSAIAAAQAAFYLALTEYHLTRGLDSLGLKWRAASVAEQYSKQGVRAGSSLPLLTALGGLCVGLAAATAETIPFIPTVTGRMMMTAIFPAGAAVFAASSIVVKDQCEIDAKATLSITETGMTGLDKNFTPKPPLQQLIILFQRVFATSVGRLKEASNEVKQRLENGSLLSSILNWIRGFWKTG